MSVFTDEKVAEIRGRQMERSSYYFKRLFSDNGTEQLMTTLDLYPQYLVLQELHCHMSNKRSSHVLCLCSRWRNVSVAWFAHTFVYKIIYDSAASKSYVKLFT